eukprot:4158236-Pyramimonas_sp.AAC.1
MHRGSSDLARPRQPRTRGMIPSSFLSQTLVYLLCFDWAVEIQMYRRLRIIQYNPQAVGVSRSLDEIVNELGSADIIGLT